MRQIQMSVQVYVLDRGAAEGIVQPRGDEQGGFDEATDHRRHPGGAGDGVHLPCPAETAAGCHFDTHPLHRPLRGQGKSGRGGTRTLIGVDGDGAVFCDLRERVQIIGRGGLFEDLDFAFQRAGHVQRLFNGVPPVGVQPENMIG